MRLVRSKLSLIAPALVTAGLVAQACGSAGEAEPQACALCGERDDVVGSIASQSGSQAQMAGWVIASFERSTNIARVGEVDRSGIFTLGQLRSGESQTLVLLSPDYIVQSVLSINPDKKMINQWLKFLAKAMPKLIHKGPIMSFQELKDLQVQSDVASDQNGDGIPDGSTSLGAASIGLRLAGLPAVDTDTDKLNNDKDPDIDGDGILNVIDPDDNGNGIYDVFDGDANGDLVPDTTAIEAPNLDAYFKEGVHFVAVQFTLKPKDDGSGNETTLTFTTKVRDDVTPDAVQVRGAPSLLNGANYQVTDTEGNVTLAQWDRRLLDDSLNEDGNAGDRVFARKVILDAAKTPRAHEVIFFQLAFGGSAPWYMEFPYAFPPIKPAAINAQYDANSRTVLLTGNPFGEIQDFLWSINVYDADGKTIWTSQPIPGTTRQFQVQENVLVTGTTYKYSVIAQTLDKIPGYPAYTIHSAKKDLK